MALAREGKIRAETVQRLPEGTWAPHDMKGKPCCYDCQSADTLLKLRRTVPGFVAARIAVGNDRQEQYKLPGVAMGLVLQGFVRPSEPGDLENQLRWLDENAWFGMRTQEEP